MNDGPTARPIAPGRRRIGLTAAAVCAALAVIWTQIVPGEAESAGGVRSILIEWAHPLSWALLAGLALTWAPGWSSRLTSALSWMALASYVAFIGALVL